MSRGVSINNEIEWVQSFFLPGQMLMAAWIKPPLSVSTSHLPWRLWPRGFPPCFNFPSAFIVTIVCGRFWSESLYHVVVECAANVSYTCWWHADAFFTDACIQVDVSPFCLWYKSEDSLTMRWFDCRYLLVPFTSRENIRIDLHLRVGLCIKCYLIAGTCWSHLLHGRTYDRMHKR